MSTAVVRSSTAGTSHSVEITEDRLARRLAVMLAERRRQTGRSVRAVTRASSGEVGVKELKQIEAARAPLSRDRAAAVARLYGLDPVVLTADRLPLEIDPRGVISTAGSAISFDPDDVESLLTNYLRLVRSMRREERPRAIELRRSDVEVLAHFLEMPGEGGGRRTSRRTHGRDPAAASRARGDVRRGRDGDRAVGSGRRQPAGRRTRDERSCVGTGERTAVDRGGGRADRRRLARLSDYSMLPIWVPTS